MSICSIRSLTKNRVIKWNTYTALGLVALNQLSALSGLWALWTCQIRRMSCFLHSECRLFKGLIQFGQVLVKNSTDHVITKKTEILSFKSNFHVLLQFSIKLMRIVPYPSFSRLISSTSKSPITEHLFFRFLVSWSTTTV